MEARVVEVCVDSVESAVAAQEGGADRVELCDSLLEGGTTPSAGLIEIARRHLRIGLHVMIRPRGADFLYSDVEFQAMQRDVELAGESGADGVVIGMLQADGDVDCERSAQLARLARPMSVTFHRAFDMTRDPLRALDALVDLGVERVLTSGGRPSAPDGLEPIARLVERGQNRIRILVGCGITAENAAAVLEATGAREVHVGSACRVPEESQMKYRNAGITMGAGSEGREYRIWRTSAEAVRAIVEAVQG